MCCIFENLIILEICHQVTSMELSNNKRLWVTLFSDLVTWDYVASEYVTGCKNIASNKIFLQPVSRYVTCTLPFSTHLSCKTDRATDIAGWHYLVTRRELRWTVRKPPATTALQRRGISHGKTHLQHDSPIQNVKTRL